MTYSLNCITKPTVLTLFIINKSMYSNISYPMMVVNGTLSVTTGNKCYKEKVQQYVETEQGERVFWRDFGCSLQVMETFGGDIPKITSALSIDLNRWVDVSEVLGTFDNGVMEVYLEGINP